MASANDDSLRLTFCGVRGTAPTPEASKKGHGGNTTCLEVALAPRHRLLIDCGTGIRTLQDVLPDSAGPDGIDFEIFLTHYHMDHLIGLPLFKPLYDPKNRFTFYGIGWQAGGVREALEEFFRVPWVPVSLTDTPSIKHYVDLGSGPISIGGLQITHARLNHPQGVTAYRLQSPRRSVVFATDCERGDAESDARFVSFSKHADVLIHDAQYTAEEYEKQYRGWGHSTWRQAVEAARAVEAGRLILFHHDPDRCDEELTVIVKNAQSAFPGVEAAKEGMSLLL